MRWDFQGGNWQVPRKAQNQAWGGVWATHASRENNNFLLLRCVGKRNFPHEMGLPRWELQASRKAQNDAWKGLGCPCFSGMGWEGFRMV